MEGPVDLEDADGPLARLEPVAAEGGPVLAVGSLRRPPMTEREATTILDRVDALRATGGPTVLRTAEAVLRDRARARGYQGPLRGDLVATGVVEEQRLERYLPGTEITLGRRSALRRGARRLALGIEGLERIVATRGDLTVSITAPIGPTTMAESLAAAIDTLFRVHARLGRVARGIPPIAFGVRDQATATGHFAGTNAGAAIGLSPWYVDRAAADRVRAAAPGDDGRTARRPSRPAEPGWFPVDKVLVHEVGHSVDRARWGGYLSDTPEWRRRMGEAVGVASVELALVPREPAHVAARARLVDELSAYATTNGVELFAEAFTVWFFGGTGPLAAAMDVELRRRYPDLPR
jgi:hypothetical protein